MRPAYALIGLGWLVVIAGVYAYINHRVVPLDKPTYTLTSALFSITSPSFNDKGPIPSQFTCDGSQMSPQLTISAVPETAKSLVLIMADPDVPKQLKPDGIFDHWILFNIPPSTVTIPEGGTAGVAGANGAGKNAYAGPCPPPQYEPSEHRYVFALFALDTMLPLQAGASKADVLAAMEGHVISETQLTGLYKRK